MLRLLVLAIAAIFRPKALLIAENLCLRRQLVVLQRRHPRPRLIDADRRETSITAVLHLSVTLLCQPSQRHQCGQKEATPPLLRRCCPLSCRERTIVGNCTPWSRGAH